MHTSINLGACDILGLARLMFEVPLSAKSTWLESLNQVNWS